MAILKPRLELGSSIAKLSSTIAAQADPARQDAQEPVDI
jgi:hypothetical protein